MSLLQMSLYGGALILVILLFRAVLKNKLPRTAFLVLWAAALLRLLVPFYIPAGFSVYSVLENRAAEAAKRAASGNVGQDGVSVVYLAGPDLTEIVEAWLASPAGGSTEGGAYGDSQGGGDKGYGNLQNSGAQNAESGILSVRTVLSLIHRGGAAVLALIFLVLYGSCLRMFRSALPVKNEYVRRWAAEQRLRRPLTVRQSDRISTPLTYGIFRPVILVPAKLEDEKDRTLGYILQHEFRHICRFDVAWKLFLALAVCIHWFNPLVWAMYFSVCRDIEVACDEGVLRTFGTEKKRDYARALLGMEEKKHNFLQIYNGFGKNAVEERIGAIMKYKKTTAVAVIVAAILVVGIICCFVTSARSGDGEPVYTNVADGLSGSGESADENSLPMDSGKEPDNGSLSADSGTDSDDYESGAADLESGGNVGESGKAVSETLSGTEVTGWVAGGVMSGTEGVPEWLPSGMWVAMGEEYALTYTVEGMEEEEPAWLVAGQGYRILIPKEGWTMFGPDGWVSEDDTRVRIWITHFTESSLEGKDILQIKEELVAEGYVETTDDGLDSFCKTEDGVETRMRFLRNEEDIFGVFYAFPDTAEYREGWRRRLNNMAAQACLVSNPFIEADEEENSRLRTVEGFADAYFAGDLEKMSNYLVQGETAESADFGDGTPVLGNIREAPGRRTETSGEYSVEFRISTEDSLTYLTISLIKEEGEWKVSFYGLEK